MCVPVLTLLFPAVAFIEGVFGRVVGHGELVQQRHDDLSRDTRQESLQGYTGNSRSLMVGGGAKKALSKLMDANC